jgi:hypothetical protein
VASPVSSTPNIDREEGPQPSDRADHNMNFRRQPASRAAEGVVAGILESLATCRWAHTMVESMRTSPIRLSWSPTGHDTEERDARAKVAVREWRGPKSRVARFAGGSTENGVTIGAKRWAAKQPYSPFEGLTNECPGFAGGRWLSRTRTSAGLAHWS